MQHFRCGEEAVDALAHTGCPTARFGARLRYAASVQDVVGEHPDGVTISVHVKPKASKSRVLGVREAALEVAVAAPPVDGAANQELERTLAAYFGMRRSSVRIVSGSSGKRKLVRLLGVTASDIRRRLEDLEAKG